MGRNRKKKGKITDKEKTKKEKWYSNNETFLKHLEDLLWTFEDIFDIHYDDYLHINNEDYHALPFPTKRNLFVHLLEFLASCLEQNQDQNQDQNQNHKQSHDTMINNESNGLYLLTMEDVAYQIRMQGTLLKSDLIKKRSVVLSQFETLQHLVHDENSKDKDVDDVLSIQPLDMTEMTLLAKSIVSQYLKQLDTDHCIIQSSIHSLTNIYDRLMKNSSKFGYNSKNDDDNYNDDDPFDFLQLTSSSEQYRIWASTIRDKMEIDSMLFDTMIMQLDDAKTILNNGERFKSNNDVFSSLSISYMTVDEIMKQNVMEINNKKNDDDKQSEISLVDDNKSMNSNNNETKPLYDTKKLPKYTHPNSVMTSNNLYEAVNQFLILDDLHSTNDASMSYSSTSILLVGPPGSGKSYMCDQIYKQIMNDKTSNSSSITQSSCKVVYPNLPIDLISPKVGESEQILLSFFKHAHAHEFKKDLKAYDDTYSQTSTSISTSTSKSILILDGIDCILGDSYNQITSKNQSFINHDIPVSLLQLRLRTIFMKIMDDIKHNNKEDSNSKIQFHFLLICTCRSKGDDIANRFDIIFTLNQPDENQRKDIIVSCLSPISSSIIKDDDKECQDILSRVARCTIGRSAAEISLCCREVIEQVASLSTITKEQDSTTNVLDVWKLRLCKLDESLHTIAPESIRGEALDGIVNIQIYTSKELLSELSTNSKTQNQKTYQSPLFGDQANKAWEQLHSLIVIPLCQSDALDDLLYGNGTNNNQTQTNNDQYQNNKKKGGKIICAGALVTGPPGSGKSTLVRFCASMAASITPSIKLLDVSCTSLIHKEMGGTERAIEKMFIAAKSAAPCILLLDGIEIIAPLRGNDTTTEGTMDRALSTLLTEMDGIDNYDGDDTLLSSAGRVAIVGITHDPNLIDPALRRPGRLDKCIVLEHPDCKTRSEIFENEVQHLPVDFTNAKLDEPKDRKELSHYIAQQTNGKSAADIKAVCAEASMCCIRDIIDKQEASIHMNPIRSDPILVFSHFSSALKLMSTGEK